MGVANNNQVFGAILMSPAPKPAPGQQQQKPANDPFSDLGQFGGSGGFQNAGGNPGIDNYLNAKGVVPVQQQPQVAQQPQQQGGLMQPQMTPQAAPRQQPAANNFDSLFG